VMKFSSLAIATGLFSCGADAFAGSKARFAVVSPKVQLDMDWSCLFPLCLECLSFLFVLSVCP
jgi:hypothetical protein